MNRLPIDDYLSKIYAAVSEFDGLIIEASPGSGKTTRVPVELLKFGKVAVLEPRRLAAKMAARRVASELGCEVGTRVGYQFRNERVGSETTELWFFTEGTLLRKWMEDPLLSEFSVIVLDEFHERHLQTDLAAALLKRVLTTGRPNLKRVVMSATLDAKRIADYFSLPRLEVQARRFPINIEYRESIPQGRFDGLGFAILTEILNTDLGEGDVLVFLPGMREIRQVQKVLDSSLDRHWSTVILHGDLSPAEQDRTLAKERGRRKIILSTNLAESSVTIEGVTAVIDSGLQRIAGFHPGSGLPTLKTTTISQASAVQRAGRAGRTGPGVCIRLYPERDFLTWPVTQTPEILRTDLSQPMLDLLNMGISNPEQLNWLDAPDALQMKQARSLLGDLGVNESAEFQSTARKLARYGIHPRLARVYQAYLDAGLGTDGARILGAWSDGQEPEGDLLNFRPLPGRGSARLERFVKQTPEKTSKRALGSIWIQGFPDRVGQVRGDEVRLTLGETANLSKRVEGGHLLKSGDLILVLEADERKHRGDTKASREVTAYLQLEESDLYEAQAGYLGEVREFEWSAERKQVIEREEIRYGEIVLESTIRPVSSEIRETQAPKLFQAFKAGIGLRQDRLKECLAPWISDEQWGELAGYLEFELKRLRISTRIEDALWKWVEVCLKGKCSGRELDEIQWWVELDQYLADVAPGDRFIRSARLMNGKSFTIHFAPGRLPWIEGYIQDFFGVKSLPDSRLSQIQWILLGPHKRPVQTTPDLIGFWKGTYVSLRRELSRDYPRHYWPEDPMTAIPVLHKKKAGLL